MSTFYLRSCDTGRLIGPIQMTSDYPLPQLGKGTYVVANPNESELDIRKCLLGANLYENHYLDCTVNDVVGTIRQMLEHRIDDKAPEFRVEDLDAILLTMDIRAEEPAYEVLFRIAAKALARVFIDDGAVVLSRKKLTEPANLDTSDL